ncbi:hypothetical protein [Noviherbaspirillum sp. ST9]|uniref:hypothetical protein n=1 Tax=Noviherbaspirillum sp. ST9 TaxID=3401606 RepID=UPI003B587D40
MNTKEFEQRFPDMYSAARKVNRYLMDDYTRPNPAVLYVSKNDAVKMLSDRYRTAHRMSRAQLEEKLNYRAAMEMEKKKVALFCYLCVVGDDGEYDEPVFSQPQAYLGHQHAPEFAYGSHYQVELAKDEWVRAWRGSF